MLSNSTIAGTSFPNEVVGEKCINYRPLLLLCLLMVDVGEGLAIGCYPLFLDNRVCLFSELPSLSPDLLFYWIDSTSFSTFPNNHVSGPL